jgi:hypothetical protein
LGDKGPSSAFLFCVGAIRLSFYSNILENIVAIGIGISFHSLRSATSSLLGIRRKLRQSQLCAFFLAQIFQLHREGQRIQVALKADRQLRFTKPTK